MSELREWPFTPEAWERERDAAPSALAGLSKPHISPPSLKCRSEALQRLLPSSTDGVERHSRIEITPNGSLLEVQRDHNVKAAHTRGERGEITRFSAASARRLRKKVSKMRREELPAFAALTYPDAWGWSGKQIKRDLDNLGKRFRRRFPSWSFIWKLEFQRRKSGTLSECWTDRETGEVVGCFMPHFHLVIYGPQTDAGMEYLRKWLAKNWAEVVGADERPELDEMRRVLRSEADLNGKSNGEAHAEAGTRAEWIESQKGVQWYVSQYMGKQQDSLERHGVGRFWGVVGRGNLPLGETVAWDCSDADARAVLRVLKRLREQPRLRIAMWHVCNGADWWRWLDELTESRPNAPPATV